jgi:DNA-binding transcriptional MerR regulator
MLKAIVDTLDSVPEAARAFYEEKEGKFALKVDGMEDVSGLKTALQKEREAAKEAKRYKDLGLSVEEIAELKAMREKADEDKAKAAGDFDKLREKLTGQHQAELKKIQDRMAALERSEHQAVVTSGLMKALAEAGATEEGMSLLPDIFAGRAKIESVDDKRVVKIMDADGTPMLVKGRDATFADLAAAAGEKYPSLFKATVKSGSGTPPGGNGAGRTTGKEVKASELEAMGPRDKAAFFKANPNVRIIG